MKLIKEKYKQFFYFLIIIIIILVSFIINQILFIYNKKQILIEVDISKSFLDGEGPIQIVKSLKDILPYETKKCKFIPSNSITPINGKNKSDYFFLPFPCLAESVYEEWNKIDRSKSLLLGPYFVPTIWNYFPYQGFWNEKRFKEILKTIKGVVVHSKRIRKYLSSKSNTTDLLNKYKFLRPCTDLVPKYIKNFENRTIDIMYYEKFDDLDKRKQSEKLIKYFIKTKLKVERITFVKYRKFNNKKRIMKLANNAKFIIYFSFYDIGGITLKEIQNYGVFCFTHEEDFALNEKTSFLIPELHSKNNMKPAFDKIMKKIQKISNSHPNTQLIAKINQDVNKCQRAFDDLCKGL